MEADKCSWVLGIASSGRKAVTIEEEGLPLALCRALAAITIHGKRTHRWQRVFDKARSMMLCYSVCRADKSRSCDL
tara:strand:- start:22433 stop:22660 length:228 start_codon:yes stop_codon:yes gene_type:complete